jgi:hypothetical protein
MVGILDLAGEVTDRPFALGRQVVGAALEKVDEIVIREVKIEDAGTASLAFATGS